MCFLIGHNAPFLAKRDNRHVRHAGMETAAYFLEKAAQCRRLADSITRQDDPAKAALSALAVEFEANAKAIQAREAAAREIGLGDDVAPMPPEKAMSG
jgi:DNA-binding LytR/AlgR family response regulator